MYRYIFGIAVFLLLSLNLNAQSSTEDFKGTWIGWDQLIKIYEDENGLQGIYIDENGNQTQKERVLQDLVFEDGDWMGKIYSKKRNRTTKAKCTLKSPRELKVKLIIGFISKSVIWEKVDKDNFNSK